MRSSSACLAACWMFAGSLAWLFIGFRGACAQLSKRMLVPSRVCSKHLRASLNKQPQPCSAHLSAVLGCTRGGESKVPSCKGEWKKIVVSLISQLAINVIFKLYLKAPGTDDHSVALPGLVRGVAAMCPELGRGYFPWPARGVGSALTAVAGPT